MRIALAALLLLAPFALPAAHAATGMCSVPGSTCSPTDRCLVLSLVCETDYGAACGSGGTGSHETRAAGGASMKVTCSGTAQTSRVDLVALTWGQTSSGSWSATTMSASAIGFRWSSGPGSCMIGVGATQHTCVASVGPPAPPVPSGQLLP